MQVLKRLAFLAEHSTDERQRATADMIIIAFFFLLRPGEYTDDGSTESTPFRLEDVQIFIGDRRLNLATCSDSELLQATFSSLTFTDQKNGVRGEVIGLGLAGHHYICPTKALVRRILYLRRHQAPSDTPLARLFDCRAKGVSAKHITQVLKDTVKSFNGTLGFTEHDVSARCLRAAGANALLLSKASD
mmetsp:Transcript_21703/g.49130  ORF Transcript_21703/g.49130 Transcript_21703/m.49130 type:complete len:189 (-) Transcript_21703:926-1492(-)